MTDRLTRAQRKKIESETHQKLDLDNLAQVNVQELIEHKEPEAPTAQQQQQQQTESESESDSSSDDSDEEDESSDEEDVDLDELLNKAQSALQSQAADIALEDTPSDKINTALPKMDIGITVQEELYLKNVNGRTKLVPDAVTLVDDNTKPTNKASIVLKESKETTQPLTKKQRQEEREKTSGKAWFDMPRPEMTEEVKRDLQVLKMRHILDRKRHYKRMGKQADPKYFQVGTIIESPTEFFSARINKKDRKQTIVDELMASDEMKQYYKRKYNEVYDRNTSGGKKHYKKLKAQRQWAK